MEQHKSCSFFGHRKLNISDSLIKKTILTIEDLIVNKGVLYFLFGSRSEFDSLCHKIVTELKIKYPNIKRIAYTCKNETCILAKKKEVSENEFVYIRPALWT